MLLGISGSGGDGVGKRMWKESAKALVKMQNAVIRDAWCDCNGDGLSFETISDSSECEVNALLRRSVLDLQQQEYFAWNSKIISSIECWWMLTTIRIWRRKSLLSVNRACTATNPVGSIERSGSEILGCSIVHYQYFV